MRGIPIGTPEKAKQAAAMHADGMTWVDIGKVLGCSATTAHCWGDPEYAEHRRKCIRKCRKVRLGKPLTRVVKPAFDIQALLATIPVDTRDLTQRACGDPLPGRSALDNYSPIEVKPIVPPLVPYKTEYVKGNQTDRYLPR